jgi:hypothetical protein
MARITLFICDKDSGKINVRHFAVTDYKNTKQAFDEIIAEADKEFNGYYYDAESDIDVTDEERELLRQIGLNEELI